MLEENHEQAVSELHSLRTEFISAKFHDGVSKVNTVMAAISSYEIREAKKVLAVLGEDLAKAKKTEQKYAQKVKNVLGLL